MVGRGLQHGQRVGGVVSLVPIMVVAEHLPQRLDRTGIAQSGQGDGNLLPRGVPASGLAWLAA